MDRDLRSPSGARTLVLCAAAAVAMAACGSDNGITPSGPPGTLVVTAATSGPDADANGFRVAIDSGPAQTLGTNGSTTFEEVPSGEHSLVVSGVSGNCTVANGDDQRVVIPPEDTAKVNLQITCSLRRFAFRLAHARASLLPFANLLLIIGLH